MPEKTAIFLILLLPLAWGVIFLVRYWIRGGAASSLKDDVLLPGQWELTQRTALCRHEVDHNDMWAEDEWIKKEEPDTAHVYPVHTTPMDHFKKVHHVGEEKEAIFPERKKPGIRKTGQ